MMLELMLSWMGDIVRHKVGAEHVDLPEYAAATRAIAERTGCYAPGPTRYEYDEQKSLVAAFVTVKKLVAGQWFDVEESAYYEEYRGSSPIWKKMPRVMLAKCAESRALRRAFSSELSGLYSPEEMDQARDDRAGIPEAVVVEQPRVTVEQPRTEPAERSAAFVAAANAIEEAESMEALGAVAKRVKDAAAVLSHAENSELRSLYLQKRTVLGGAK